MSDEYGIARVASAMCVADGNDPETETTDGTDDTESDNSGLDYRHTITVPAWTTYAGEARRMIAAVRLIGLLEQGTPALKSQNTIIHISVYAKI